MGTSYVGPDGDGWRATPLDGEIELVLWDTDQEEQDWYLSTDEAYELATALMEYVKEQSE